jgi:hypothetical protein
MSPAEKPRAAAANGRVALRWLPAFLAIGTMPCGSTRLYELLKCHPNLRISAIPRGWPYASNFQMSSSVGVGSGGELDPPANTIYLIVYDLGIYFSIHLL